MELSWSHSCQLCELCQPVSAVSVVVSVLGSRKQVCLSLSGTPEYLNPGVTILSLMVKMLIITAGHWGYKLYTFTQLINVLFEISFINILIGFKMINCKVCKILIISWVVKLLSWDDWSYLVSDHMRCWSSSVITNNEHISAVSSRDSSCQPYLLYQIKLLPPPSPLSLWSKSW